MPRIKIQHPTEFRISLQLSEEDFQETMIAIEGHDYAPDIIQGIALGNLANKLRKIEDSRIVKVEQEFGMVWVDFRAGDERRAKRGIETLLAKANIPIQEWPESAVS